MPITHSTTIALDVMTAEAGIASAVNAAVKCLRQHQELSITLVGDQLLIEEVLESSHRAYWRELSLKIIHTDVIISHEDDPLHALKAKRQSSTHQSVRLVAENQADAVVSCANTGALLAIGRYMMKRRKDVDKLALVAAFPTYNRGESYLCDVGANYDATPKDLHRQAIMASEMFKRAHSDDSPRVALLNIGTESYKGNELATETIALLQRDPTINFCGSVEGNDIFKGDVDVVICDGFVGNCVLKSCEGTANFVMSTIKQACMTSTLTKLLGGALRSVLRTQAPRLNPSLRNGAFVLGLNGIIIKSHGNADTLGIETAIKTAMKACSSTYFSSARPKTALHAEASTS